MATYTVKKGDTVSAIARRYGVPVSAVSGYKSGNADKIQPGEVLTIRTPQTATLSNSALSPGQFASSPKQDTRSPSYVVPQTSTSAATRPATTPIFNEPNRVAGSTTTVPQVPTISSSQVSNLPPELSETLSGLEKYLTELEKRGQVINPNIQITPEQVAEFTRQAEREINPFYSTQLKLAREKLLKDIGYSTEEIGMQEQLAERKYRKDLRTLGENFAEQGFAQSGLRNREEQDLAFNTQSDIDATRRRLEFSVGDAARGFAQKFGSRDLPQFNIGSAPSVSAGESSFARPSGVKPLYTLDPSIYDSLVGEQEFQRRGSVQSRASQLEQAFRSNEALKQARQLTL